MIVRLHLGDVLATYLQACLTKALGLLQCMQIALELLDLLACIRELVKVKAQVRSLRPRWNQFQAEGMLDELVVEEVVPVRNLSLRQAGWLPGVLAKHDAHLD